MNARSSKPVAAVLVSLVAFFACGDDDGGQTSPLDAGSLVDQSAPVCPESPPPEKPQAACDVTIDSPPISGLTHVPEGTVIDYCSNPPSSGNHYPVWADFREYAEPIEWPYLVHSMEHGAVVLLYKCDSAGCPEVVEAFRQVRDGAAIDPLCPAETKRFIIAPSPTIPTKVAAAAWGKTYQADCVDLPTLEAFARDNYAKGPENLCNPGRSF